MFVHPKTIIIGTSLITDHCNKYNNEKVWKIVRIAKMWHRDTKWANVIGQKAPTDLLHTGLPQTFNLIKKKCSTCTSVKWSTIKWGLSVLYWRNKNQTRILCLCLQLVIHKTIWVPLHAYTSTLAWKIPWMEEPGRLQSMGSLTVRHKWATSLSLFTFTHWRRKWQPTPVLLPGESQGRRSLVGCRLWGRTEWDTTVAT